jgi:carboxyl-terminal processing protease
MAPRLLRVGAAVLVVLIVYGAGVATALFVVSPAGDDTGRPGGPAPTAGSEGGRPGAGGVLDEAAARIATQAARPVDRSSLQRAAVEGMLAELADPWSAYYPARDSAQLQEGLLGRYTGVGLWLRASGPGEVPTVGAVAPGSPAAQAGLQAGDALLAVGGRDVTTLPADDVARLLRGRAGSHVRLRVLTGQGVSELTLMRAPIASDAVHLTRARDGVVVLAVSSFTRGVGRSVRQALGSLTPAPTGVVLDLRGNPGGLLDEAVEVASAFLDGGVVVSYDRRGQGRTTLRALSHGDVHTPLVVLVDSATASAAEVTAAALQDRHRAVIVGSRTYGKGSVQEPSRLDDGSALELTVGRYYTPSGRAIDGVGVEPDVLVDSTAPPRVAERRAVEVLTGLVAAAGVNGRG